MEVLLSQWKEKNKSRQGSALVPCRGKPLSDIEECTSHPPVEGKLSQAYLDLKMSPQPIFLVNS